MSPEKADPYVTLARLALRFGAVQKPGELESLCRLVHRERVDTVLEVGTALGGTFYCWLQVAKPDALLISVDLPHGSYRCHHGDPLETPDRLRAEAKPEQRLEFVREDSHAPETLEAVERILDGREVDFLFIDGDHTYEGVRADFEMYAPLVREGGLVGFHDIVTHRGIDNCEVKRLWEEVKRTHKEQWSFVERGDDPSICGIGVIRIKRKGDLLRASDSRHALSAL